ncbi:hypothetical protein SLEP1_g58171 [Rubroshorea leprosula]|uniref:Bulb-type lectin domain-containing protein n=1 Tax=Rubroshorea leprosula TaxID=152421 RepID=A0AAV5MNK5_9ROSI|nr:hypothetical protein SLEP1_g58171 [Rubroshorea leprosula]
MHLENRELSSVILGKTCKHAVFSRVVEGKLAHRCDKWVGTIVSSNGSFELGFFCSGSSGRSCYLGIWFRKVSVHAVVWVANKCSPIDDLSGVLVINSTGNLVLLSQSRSVVWASNSKIEAQNPVVRLQDSGNLVLKDRIDGKSEILFWQSFDYPTDTLLAGMKLGWDLRVGLNRQLSAWKSQDDPCPGDLTYGMAPYNFPDTVMWKGSKKYFMLGPWNGNGFSGQMQFNSNQYLMFNMTSNEEETYFMFYISNISLITRLTLTILPVG